MITKDELEYAITKALQPNHWKYIRDVLPVRDLCTDIMFVIENELTKVTCMHGDSCKVPNCLDV